MRKLEASLEILRQSNILKEIIIEGSWYYKLPEELLETSLTGMAYDSRKVAKDFLFFCKGLNFKEDYLLNAIKQGAKVYVSDKYYENISDNCIAIIVTDIRKAMAIMSMNYYDYPQNELKIIAYTGTKGKTTSAYFCHSILQQATDNKAALFSTLETHLGGDNTFTSELTTAESLDLYRMMREAVTNGVTHLVMEVSSQAYKQERVYGLTYDIGVFLNISPDHISPIEHPDFDDYFYCKRRLFHHSRQMILNMDSDYADFLKEVSEYNKDDFWTYSGTSQQADIHFESLDSKNFTVDDSQLNLAETYEIQVEGAFNQTNAVSALMACSLILNKETSTFKDAVKKTTIPGRMEKIQVKDSFPVYIDYAHNHLSLDVLLSFIADEYPDRTLRLVIGSTGDKGQTRRLSFGKVISKYIDHVYLTSDDPGTEDPLEIAAVIEKSLTGTTQSKTISDRQSAIEAALDDASAEDVVIIAGKGADRYQIIGTKKVDYIGDGDVVFEWLKKRGFQLE
ncbi:UDP-N-acetylmuramyl-tripeptide synthetase [Vagococcus elongatus]|uniref:UDP-N-acetylmuramyl-tripeptide synthetase n=1 Tax=Vagococcus elongatus TaxID=180344 RepID=A0A430B5I8_9ENTE|nr:UDP-N-acetylmuramyl-tripeptide synthetase [Vagococcus elongatus]RSU15595.1 hypothetical protein CBF29_00535 [Vagococcus elongatus]